MLEKTLESPLDCKEIQPVHPKGDHPWIFIGKSDAEAEAPVLWPPYVKNWLIGKDPDAGKDWRQKERGMTEVEMAERHHLLRNMSLSRLQELAVDRVASMLPSMGSLRQDWVTKQRWICPFRVCPATTGGYDLYPSVGQSYLGMRFIITKFCKRVESTGLPVCSSLSR